MTAAAPIILVVEDEALVQVLVVEVLQERGYAVQAAASAAEALVLLRDRCGDIDVLLTDINLGAGENGLELAHKARVLCPGIRVIYVTGGAYAKALTERVPDSVLIPKPYELDQICEEVARALPPRRAG
ncbi:MAG TPA: response regulator [Caulobacteraceae bacterium]|jgi:DNA-binding NtrC family response regulator